MKELKPIPWQWNEQARMLEADIPIPAEITHEIKDILEVLYCQSIADTMIYNWLWNKYQQEEWHHIALIDEEYTMIHLQPSLDYTDKQ